MYKLTGKEDVIVASAWIIFYRFQSASGTSANLCGGYGGFSVITPTPNRNDISFSEWMKLDLEYIDNWSLTLDFRLIIKTFRVVLFGNGR